MKKNQEIENYDAKLGISIIGDIDYGKGVYTSVALENGNEFEDKEGNLLSLLYNKTIIESYNSGVNQEATELIRRLSQESFEKKLQQAKMVLDKKLIKTVLEGRVKIAQLINSPGGRFMEQERLEDAYKLLHKNGGKIHTFVGHLACSAGFHAYAQSDWAASMQYTNFMHHMSSASLRPDQDADFIEDMKNAYMRPIHLLAKRANDTRFLEYFEKIVEDEDDKEKERDISPISQKKLGILNEVYGTIDEMRKKFREEFPELINTGERFFDIMEKLNHKIHSSGSRSKKGINLVTEINKLRRQK